MELNKTNKETFFQQMTINDEDKQKYVVNIKVASLSNYATQKQIHLLHVLVGSD